MKPILRHLSVTLIAFVGCADEAASSDTELMVAVNCPVSGTKIDHSLAITDPTVLARFPFTRTTQQVLTSAGAQGQTTKQLYQQWMSTFGPTDCTNPKIDPNHYGEVCPRNPEFKLASVDPTDPKSTVQFVPVGLFDRFDLAPGSGTNCGEARIVYAMHSSDPNINGRGFYIFEAALPNPDPQAGLVGCLGVAEFWQSLSNISDPTLLADTLEKFYYVGGVVAGVGPVVDAKNYGLAHDGGAYTAGQIRSNMFIDFTQWHLREFKTDLTCPAGGTACTLAIDHVTVKNNPANEVFDGTSKNAAAFLLAFPNNVKPLASKNVSTIHMATANKYNEFESISQLPVHDVDYDQFTDAALTQAIQDRLTQLGINLTPGDILRRATTQTCGGCHQQSSGPEAQLGGGLTWPPSLGFVQIDETSNLSPALTTEFLPHRKAVLERFINRHCVPQAEEDTGLTVGGSEVGAAN
jgi:hypothetical protein